MLLSTLQYTLQSCAMENRLAHNVRGAKVEKLYCSHHLDHNPFREKNIQNLISPVSRPSCQLLLLLLAPYDVNVENWSNATSP